MLGLPVTAWHPTGAACGCVLLGKRESKAAHRGLFDSEMLYIPLEKHVKCLIFLGCVAAVQILVCIDPAVVPFTLVCSFKRVSLLILYPHRLLFQAVLLMRMLRVSWDCLSVGSCHLQLSFLHQAALPWLSFSVHSEHTDVYSTACSGWFYSTCAWV